jgi:hypothetical protein
MIDHKYTPTQTVYFRIEGQINSGVILACGKSKEVFKDSSGKLISQILTNNIYFIHGFSGKQFPEHELKETVEELL